MARSAVGAVAAPVADAAGAASSVGAEDADGVRVATGRARLRLEEVTRRRPPAPRRRRARRPQEGTGLPARTAADGDPDPVAQRKAGRERLRLGVVLPS